MGGSLVENSPSREQKLRKLLPNVRSPRNYGLWNVVVWIAMRVKRDNRSFRTRFTTVMISSFFFHRVCLFRVWLSSSGLMERWKMCTLILHYFSITRFVLLFFFQDSARSSDVCPCQLPITCSWRFFNSVVFFLFTIMKQTSPSPPDVYSITYKLANKHNKEKTVFTLLSR